MKIQCALASAVVTGVVLGAMVTQSLQARTAPPVYFVAEIDEITDVKGFEALRKTGSSNIVEAKMLDGRYLVRTENVTGLDGATPKFFVVIAFDNITKAKTFSDNMKETNALRAKATRSRSFIVEGL
ncbi:MAG TPA: DUF1330 domain-containing protein [Pseudolabrys sp.]|nr:DUF1330 domain-containing protein [Pseudolabrys sp.]